MACSGSSDYIFDLPFKVHSKYSSAVELTASVFYAICNSGWCSRFDFLPDRAMYNQNFYVSSISSIWLVRMFNFVLVR